MQFRIWLNYTELICRLINCEYISLSVKLPIYPFSNLPIHLSIYPSINLTVHLPTYPSINLFIHLPTYPSINLSVRLTIYPSVNLLICLSFHPLRHKKKNYIPSVINPSLKSKQRNNPVFNQQLPRSQGNSPPGSNKQHSDVNPWSPLLMPTFPPAMFARLPNMD